MAVTPSDPSLPPEVLDLLLLRAPADVLLLDTTLTCRYAAPAGDEFLGMPREALVGRPVGDVLPPAANGLRPVLEAAARTGAPWQEPRYRFICPVRGVPTAFCAAIQVEPVVVGDHRGVLVILADTRELADLAEARAALEEEVGRLRRALQDVRAAVRSLLAPISGYLQMIVRRPTARLDQSPAAVIAERVLPQITRLVERVDRAGDPHTDAPPPAG